jgi:hypothetical protein
MCQALIHGLLSSVDELVGEREVVVTDKRKSGRQIPCVVHIESQHMFMSGPCGQLFHINHSPLA